MVNENVYDLEQEISALYELGLENYEVQYIIQLKIKQE
jgi:hypothetical protein